VEVQFHTVLTSVLVEEVWSVSFAGRCNHTQRLHGNHRMENNGTQNGTGVLELKKNSCPCWKSNPDLSVIPLVKESICWSQR